MKTPPPKPKNLQKAGGALQPLDAALGPKRVNRSNSIQLLLGVLKRRHIKMISLHSYVSFLFFLI